MPGRRRRREDDLSLRFGTDEWLATPFPETLLATG
jgi:hypothetical protein